MNLASWIILGVVIAVVALAARATFSKKGRSASCHGCESCHECEHGTSCPAVKIDLLPDDRE